MEDCKMRLEKMIDVLADNSKELTNAEHNLVMHDLYIIFSNNSDKGEKCLENLVNAYKLNLKLYHNYKDNKKALNSVKKRLYKASKYADEIIGNGSTFVERYFIETIERIKNKINKRTTEKSPLIKKLDNNKLPLGSLNLNKELCFSCYFEDFEGINDLVSSCSSVYSKIYKIPGQARIEVLSYFDFVCKELDGTVNSKKIGPLQKIYREAVDYNDNINVKLN